MFTWKWTTWQNETGCVYESLLVCVQKDEQSQTLLIHIFKNFIIANGNKKILPEAILRCPMGQEDDDDDFKWKFESLLQNPGDCCISVEAVFLQKIISLLVLLFVDL